MAGVLQITNNIIPPSNDQQLNDEIDSLILEKVIGVFSPLLAPMIAENEKFVFSDYIDYASFLTILLKFFQKEGKILYINISFLS